MGCQGHENLESPRHLGAILLAVEAGQGFAECRGAGGGAAQQREKAEGLGNREPVLPGERWGTWLCKPSFWLGRQGVSKVGAEITQGPLKQLRIWSLRLVLRKGGRELQCSLCLQLEGMQMSPPARTS